MKLFVNMLCPFLADDTKIGHFPVDYGDYTAFNESFTELGWNIIAPEWQQKGDLIAINSEDFFEKFSNLPLQHFTAVLFLVAINEPHSSNGHEIERLILKAKAICDVKVFTLIGDFYVQRGAELVEILGRCDRISDFILHGYKPGNLILQLLQIEQRTYADKLRFIKTIPTTFKDINITKIVDFTYTGSPNKDFRIKALSAIFGLRRPDLKIHAATYGRFPIESNDLRRIDKYYDTIDRAYCCISSPASRVLKIQENNGCLISLPNAFPGRISESLSRQCIPFFITDSGYTGELPRTSRFLPFYEFNEHDLDRQSNLNAAIDEILTFARSPNCCDIIREYHSAYLSPISILGDLLKECNFI